MAGPPSWRFAHVLPFLYAVFYLVPSSASPPPPGTVQQLYQWWQGPGGRQGATPAFECLAAGFATEPKDNRTYSQWGEDGIIAFIFSCIKVRSKYYVEFGTENCEICSTRLLREQNWTGLLMDGGFDDPSINLHKEFMTSGNIAHLFQKYRVPLEFDHLTVDVDLNTPHLARAILAAGYRPRSMAIEYNRNFRSDQSYMVLDLRDEVWETGCYFGGSGLALNRLLKAFGYSLAAFDQHGTNLFFVRDSELGIPFPHSFADVTPKHDLEAWQMDHLPCRHTGWLRVDDSPELAGPHWRRHTRFVVLSHKNMTSKVRAMYEVTLRRQRRPL